MNGGVSGKSLGSGAVVSKRAAVQEGSEPDGDEGGGTCGFTGRLGGKPRYPSGDRKGYWFILMQCTAPSLQTVDKLRFGCFHMSTIIHTDTLIFAGN